MKDLIGIKVLLVLTMQVRVESTPWSEVKAELENQPACLPCPKGAGSERTLAPVGSSLYGER